VSDIFREVDEDVRAQEYVRLWKTYGKYVIAGMVAIVLGTAASVAWRNYQTNQARAEGDKYAAAIKEFNDGKYDEAAKALGTIGDESSRGYGLLAKLQQAEALIKAGKKDEGVKVYDKVAADGHYAKVYRDLASLSVVMQTMDTGDPDKLLARLDALNTKDNPWRFTAQELLAALALRNGNTQNAKDLFKALADDETAPDGIRGRAREMLSAMDAKS
jgi:hypothetical protein